MTSGPGYDQAPPKKEMTGISAPAKVHHGQIIKRYLFVLTSLSNLIIITKFFTMYFQYLKKLIIAEQLSFINIKTI